MLQRNVLTIRECKTFYQAIYRITESREQARLALRFVLGMVKDL